jgi:hypothetical protein
LRERFSGKQANEADLLEALASPSLPRLRIERRDEMYDEGEMHERHESIFFKIVVIAIYLIMYPFSASKRRQYR